MLVHFTFQVIVQSLQFYDIFLCSCSKLFFFNKLVCLRHQIVLQKHIVLQCQVVLQQQVLLQFHDFRQQQSVMIFSSSGFTVSQSYIAILPEKITNEKLQYLLSILCINILRNMNNQLLIFQFLLQLQEQGLEEWGDDQEAGEEGEGQEWWTVHETVRHVRFGLIRCIFSTWKRKK